MLGATHFADIMSQCSGQVRSGQVGSGQVRSGQVRSCQVMSCQVRSCHVMSCHVRSGQVRSGQVRSGQVRSGQVRSECLTCTFRASCCSARLSRTQVSAFVGSSVRNRKKKVGGRKEGPPALAGTREYEQSDRNR